MFDHKGVSTFAMRKMAGNSFVQPCMAACIAFSFAHLKHNRASAVNVIPTAVASSYNTNSRHIVYLNDKDDTEMCGSDNEDAEEIS